MGLLSGITKVVLSPVNGVAEIVRDLDGENSEEAQGISILTCGISSVIKGTAKAIRDGADDIINDS